MTNVHLATRCDASIVKLSGDIHFIRHEYRQIEKTIQELISSLETVSKNLDTKVTENDRILMCYCLKIIIVYQNAQSSVNCSKELFTSKGFKCDSSCPHTMSTVSPINKHLMSVPYVSTHPPIKYATQFSYCHCFLPLWFPSKTVELRIINRRISHGSYYYSSSNINVS